MPYKVWSSDFETLPQTVLPVHNKISTEMAIQSLENRVATYVILSLLNLIEKLELCIDFFIIFYFNFIIFYTNVNNKFKRKFTLYQK